MLSLTERYVVHRSFLKYGYTGYTLPPLSFVNTPYFRIVFDKLKEVAVISLKDRYFEIVFGVLLAIDNGEYAHGYKYFSYIRCGCMFSRLKTHY